ncbi:MAG: substrate-binding domain-containing protein [Treponema sp.]|jgi:ribose transport system substrate-binding protein|nr:substrate-binding domain-containing protein [Treponema sp.]
MKKILYCVLLVLLVLGTTLGCKKESAGTDGSKKYRIALSNNYMGNDWRQVMLKTIQVVAAKPPYSEKVELTIVNSENSPEAQSAAIDVMIEEGYDAILIDAASPTALNPVIDRALAAGIVVVSFDNVVSNPKVHTIHIDLKANGKGWAEFIVKQLKPGDTVAIDTGLPGSTVGNDVYDAAMEVFQKAGIRVVAEFASEWSDGVGQQQIASVLAANPDLDGLLCQAFGETIDAAFTQAGKPFIPCTGYHTNAGQLSALNKKIPFCSANNPPGNSAFALDVALRLLEGEEILPMDISVVPQFFAIPEYANVDIGYPITTIEKDVTVFDNAPGALPWPVLPLPFTSVNLSIDEVANFKQ